MMKVKTAKKRQPRLSVGVPSWRPGASAPRTRPFIGFTWWLAGDEWIPVVDVIVWDRHRRKWVTADGLRLSVMAPGLWSDLPAVPQHRVTRLTEGLSVPTDRVKRGIIFD